MKNKNLSGSINEINIETVIKKLFPHPGDFDHCDEIAKEMGFEMEDSYTYGNDNERIYVPLYSRLNAQRWLALLPVRNNSWWLYSFQHKPTYSEIYKILFSED